MKEITDKGGLMMKLSTFTAEERKHFELVASFFGESGLIGGEYPFYTSDAMLDDTHKVRKTVIKGGKKRSISMPPVSMSTEYGGAMVDNHIVNNTMNPPQHCHNSFYHYALTMYKQILTATQLQYVQDCMAGNESKYTRKQRYKFRSNMQLRLRRAFIGIGGANMSNYMVAEYKNRLKLVDSILEQGYNNTKFADEIIKNIDRDYINEIVYEKISSEARQAIVDYYFKKLEKIPVQYLNEVFEIILSEKERLTSMKLQY